MIPKSQKISLYCENVGHVMFPLICDKDVGIHADYQNIVIESVSMISLSTMMTIGRQPAHSCNKV
jgi:hypothetical protein